jgi:hypothetical protein
MAAWAVTAAICVAAAPVSRAAGRNTVPFTRFVAMAPIDGDPGSPARVDIIIDHWSPEAELQNLRAAFRNSGPGGLLSLLKGIGRPAGVLLIPGVPASGARARLRHPINVYFAREVETAGGRQVVLATDRYLAFGQVTVNWPSNFEFSLLDIRFAADGTGVGKVATADKLAVNARTGAIELANYDAQPARLIDVRPQAR